MLTLPQIRVSHPVQLHHRGSGGARRAVALLALACALTSSNAQTAPTPLTPYIRPSGLVRPGLDVVATDAHGALVVGATVEIWPIRDPHDSVATFSTAFWTDKKGSVHVDLAAAPYEVCVSARDLEVRCFRSQVRAEERQNYKLRLDHTDPQSRIVE